MSIEYLGLSQINGPLIVLEGIRGASFDEIVELTVEGNKKKLGRIVELYEDKAVIQVFQGTEDMSLFNTHTKLTGHPMEVSLSPEILGRVFNGVGQPIGGLGNIVSETKRDVNGQPLLAALCAYARDPIFRMTATFVLGSQEGATIPREAIEEFIDEKEPGRFSKATLKSTAQNINSTLTQSGHLAGHVRKVRVRAEATPGTVSFALLLGYVNGLRGESLFKSEFTQMLDCSFEKTIELAEDASRRGWISLKRVGQVVEVLFPNLITAQEMEWLREQN